MSLGKHGKFGDPVDSKLIRYIVAMGLYCAWCNAELTTNLFVDEPVSDESKNQLLLVRQELQK